MRAQGANQPDDGELDPSLLAGQVELDPHQSALEADFPPRFDIYTDAQHTVLLEMAVMDDSVQPYIAANSEEEEKVLKPDVSQADYIRWARLRAFGIKGRNGRFLKKYSASPSLLLAQEKEVVERTITRLGKKYYGMQADTERFALDLDFNETEADGPATIKGRADMFLEAVLSGEGLISDAYGRLERFIPISGLTREEARTMSKLMADAFQTNNTERLNRIATLTLAHEIKRAGYYRELHDRFAHYRMERLTIWHRIEEPGVIPMIVRDETVSGKPWLVRSQTDLELPETVQARLLQPLEHKGTFLENRLRDIAKHINGQDLLENYWRKGLVTLRRLGQLALDTILPPERYS